MVDLYLSEAVWDLNPRLNKEFIPNAGMVIEVLFPLVMTAHFG